jgi:hypothetical protein
MLVGAHTRDRQLSAARFSRTDLTLARFSGQIAPDRHSVYRGVKLVRKATGYEKKAEAHYPAAASPAARAELCRHRAAVSVTQAAVGLASRAA